ncbi:hypothetical protein [Kytococcus schroeteri]|uniref:hypothetical protein n=1 Tax=Kytococcus schroeteri TaxID=138300 RepID=UPI001144DB38|nr:hypothetical protein [Kytococcus schroeteri]
MRSARHLMFAVPAVAALAGSPFLQGLGPTGAVAATDDAFVKGTVIGIDGEVPRHTTITVNISPSQDELVKQANEFSGAPTFSSPMGVEGIPVADDGTFSVTEAQLASTPATTGVHDVTVIAVDPTGGVSTHVSSMAWDARTKQLTPVPMSDPTEGTATIDEETGDITRGPETGIASAARAPQAGAATAGGSASPDEPLTLQMKLDGVAPKKADPSQPRTSAAGCGVQLVDTWDEPAVMGEVWSTTGGHVTEFTLAGDSSSETEVAVKAGSGWKAGGTVSRRLTSTFKVSDLQGNKRQLLKTWWKYGKYNYWSCRDGYVYSTQVKAIHRQGGGWHTYGSIPAAWHCYRYQPNQSEKLDRNRATNWTNGVDTSDAIGIDLAIRSGYSATQSLETRVKSTDTDGLRLCGLNTGPAADPRTWVIRG